MKEKILKILMVGMMLMQFHLIAYAGEASQMSKNMIESIFVFAQYSGWFLVSIGICFLILSMKSTSGPTRSTAMKFIGAGLALIAARTVASRFGWF